VRAARRSDFELIDAAGLVTADSLETKKESRERRQAADDVVRDAERTRSVL
jgi:hypothetical protein